MPPKAPKKKDASVAAPKLTAQQIAIEDAENDGIRMFRQHEQQRQRAEQADRVLKHRLQLDAVIEKSRLKSERHAFADATKDLVDEERLVCEEHAKHTHWQHMSDASRMPNIHKESEVNTFLSVWRGEEEDYLACTAETKVIISGMRSLTHNPGSMRFFRGEQGLAPAERQRFIDDELARCMDAYELAQALLQARDSILKSNTVDCTESAKDTKQAAIYANMLERVYAQISHAIDFITTNALLYYDIILDDETGETMIRRVQKDNVSVIRYGLWVKAKDVTRSFASLIFADIDVRLDPKQNSVPKLPRALGLSRENVAVRVVQTVFDPHDSYTHSRNGFYALNCVIQVDLLTFADRPKSTGEWLARAEVVGSQVLHRTPYPPHQGVDNRGEDTSLRISLELPSTVVIRQPSLLVGKWVESEGEWEPCSHTSLGATFSNNTRFETNSRRVTFVSNELRQFAILQEKVFDAPFEQWSLRPLSEDSVMFTLECRRRGEVSDREFSFLIEGAFCRLHTPDHPELARLRESWHEPTALFRELALSGFNFVMQDTDAQFFEKVLPKSRALEQKAYADIAHCSQFHIIASTRHNKFGEDSDMALFRVSKQFLSDKDDDGELYAMDKEDVHEWYSIRYRQTNCAFSVFDEKEVEADLHVMPGTETHYNLYSLLLPVVGEDLLKQRLMNSNFLLQRCIYEILMLVRPLTWG